MKISFDPWGNRMSYSAWNTPQTQTLFTFDRGFTGHEHYDSLHIINANARLYDPTIGRFFSPDPIVQAPDFTQAYNRYSYCMNNPVMYSDPTGEVFVIDDLIAAAAIGAIFNSFTRIVAGNVNNAVDFFLSAGIGALSGTLGGFAGQSIANMTSVATSVGGAVFNGAVVGACGGFAGGFVSSVGNSWVNGAGFVQGLQAGLIGGGQGALCGAFVGGITGGFRYQKQIHVFQKGCVDLGINGVEPVPVTDCFLSEAQQVWYKDAPIDLLDAFSVEDVPHNYQMDMDAIGAPGITVPTIDNNIIKGKSSVYFNKNLAFSSAKQLFFTMGHEFVHVSQFGALANNASKLLTSDFLDMLDYHAYSYQNALGGLHLNSYTREQIMSWSRSYSQFYNMNYICFPWTSNHSFIYPF